MNGGAPGRLAQHLARRTTTGRFIPAIDGLRFVAIALVVAFHLDLYVGSRLGVRRTGLLYSVIHHGDVGVLLFFGISGFILGLPFARAAAGSGRPVSVKAYFLRRLTRLEPPYIVAMTALLIAFVVIRGADLLQLLPHHLASVAYLHGLVYRGFNPINGVAWSLEVEIQFYLIAPVLALIYLVARPWQRRGILAAVGLGAALLQLGPLDGAAWRPDFTVIGHLQQFIAGMIIADIVARSARTSLPGRRRRWIADAAGACGLLALVASSSPASRALVLPIAIAGCLWAAIFGVLAPRVLSVTWIYIIGGMCYSIYLLHYAVISLVGPTTTRVQIGSGYLANLAIQFVLLGIAILALSTVFFVLIERPCMDPNWPLKAREYLRQRFSTIRSSRHRDVGMVEEHPGQSNSRAPGNHNPRL